MRKGSVILVVNEKYIGLKKYIVDGNGSILYRVRSKGIFDRGEYICNVHGSIIFDITENKSDDSFVIKDYENNSEITAKVKGKVNIYTDKLKLSFPGEFYIDKYEQYKELSIKYRDEGVYDIFAGNKNIGNIRRGCIKSEYINNNRLLAVLLVFSRYIINDEEMCMAASISECI